MLQASKISIRWKRSPSFEKTNFNNNFENDNNNEINSILVDKETQTDDFSVIKNTEKTISIQIEKLFDPLKSDLI